MNRRKLGIRIGILIVFIFLANFLSMKFHWYSLLWWLDMPMHFLGGVWIGLSLIYFFPLLKLDFRSIFKIIFGVFIIATLWEVFEVLVDENIARNGFDILDTLSDLFFGLAGGLSAVLYFFKRISSNL